MKVLLVHNAYQQRGGEDAVVSAEAQLLAAKGHNIVQYRRHNDELRSGGWFGKTSAGFGIAWSSVSYRAVRDLLAQEKPDVAHFHNTFPLISPSAYYACADAGVAVVQTLHNYRLLCPAATFFRDGHVCEECVEHSLWRGVRHGCYRKSRSATATVALMLAFHRWRQTWTEKVDCYIALTEFARRKFIDAGLPRDKIVVKPSLVHPDPGARNNAGDYAVFAGRLSPEKGLHTLLLAWQHLGNHIPLRIVGDGPLRASLEAQKSRHGLSSLSFQGWASPEQALAVVKGACFLIFPSECYETFGATIAEAFACGVPVIASRLGAMAELVEDGRTGLHCTPGDADDLAAKVEWAWTHPREMGAMGWAARSEYEAKYTGECDYGRLVDIYRQAREQSHRSASSIPAPHAGTASCSSSEEEGR